MKRPLTAFLAGLILTLLSCEDAMTSVVQESVRLAQLPERTLTIQLPANGTSTPVGVKTIKDGEPLSIASQANNGYVFYRWEKVSGPGTVEFDNYLVTSTTVRVKGGDAVIQSLFGDNAFDVAVSTSGSGSVSQGSFTNMSVGVSSGPLTATPSLNNHFVNWTVTAGSGITFHPSATASTVTFTAAGDASIRANFAPDTYALSFSNQYGGSTNPSYSATATGGVALALNAYPYETYLFNGWSKVSGTGTATFGSTSTASTTLTVTTPWSPGATLTIRASFRKEALTLNETGNLDPQANGFTTYPDDVVGVHYDAVGKGLYVLGNSGLGYGTIRKFDLTSTAAPATPSNDYRYLSSTGTPTALVSDNTFLYFGTSTKLGKLPLAGFSSSALTTVATSYAITDLSLGKYPQTGAPSILWATQAGSTGDRRRTDLAGPLIYTDTDPGGWSATAAVANSYGLYVVQEDNGGNRLHGVDVVTGASSVHAPHSGSDMDPGEVGKPVFNEDEEYFALPVDDPNTTRKVQIYDGTVPSGLVSGPIGQVTVAGKILRMTWVGPYIVAAGSSDSNVATVWIIDAYTMTAPVVSKVLTVSGYERAEFAVLDGVGFSTLWVLLDKAATKPGVKSFSVTRN